MKKLMITVFVLVVLVGGYVALSKGVRVPLSALQGVTAPVHRGDLIVPINASGNIKPASVTQVKGKASGDVIELPFDVGKMVKKGDLLVQLWDIDERNSVDRALSDYNRAKIQLQNAQISKDLREQVDGPTAQANVAKAEAQLSRADQALKFQKDLQKRSPKDVTAQTLVEVEAVHKEATALLNAAKAEVRRAEISVSMAKQDILTAQEAENVAKRTLDDANERLKETKIFSPIDGMILTRGIQKGEVVQSGKTMFTGGTVLMEIADVSDIYAVVNVDEADIGQVRNLAPRSARPGATGVATTLPEGVIEKGEPVEVTVETFKDEKFTGQIERISPQSEIVSSIATFKVWIRITSENRDKLVGLLNTQAEAHFTSKSVRNALLVSYDAIQKNPTGEDYGVYVPVQLPGKDQREAKFKQVEFGVDNGIDVEVKSGLKEGDEVYTKLPQKTQKEKEAEEKNEAK